jgi:flagellar basal-body rod protein FlgB
MNLYNIPLFGMLKAKLDWLGERQRIIADNIANASTQDFKAKDLAAPSFSDLMRMAHDKAREADAPPGSPQKTAQGDAFKPKVIEDGEMTPNGNSVVLEEQMMKVAQTQADFQSAIEIYRKGINLLHLAVRS